MAFFDPFGVFSTDPFFRESGRGLDRPMLEFSNQPSSQSALTQPSRFGQFMGSLTTPKMDVRETDKQYMVCVDVPGLKKEDINVSIQNDMLTLEGERKEEKEEKSETRYLSERSFGKFTRSVRLPADVNPETCKANVDNGVLRLSLDKMEGAGRRRIEIA